VISNSLYFNTGVHTCFARYCAVLVKTLLVFLIADRARQRAGTRIAAQRSVRVNATIEIH